MNHSICMMPLGQVELKSRQLTHLRTMRPIPGSFEIAFQQNPPYAGTHFWLKLGPSPTASSEAVSSAFYIKLNGTL